MTQHDDWLEFKAMRDELEFKTIRDEPGRKPCPFCGIKHDPGKTHPYCTEAMTFQVWRERGKPPRA